MQLCEPNVILSALLKRNNTTLTMWSSRHLSRFLPARSLRALGISVCYLRARHLPEHRRRVRGMADPLCGLGPANQLAVPWLDVHWTPNCLKHQYVIRNSGCGRPSDLSRSADAPFLCDVVVSVWVQIFYAWRIYQLSKWRLVPLVIVIVSSSRYGLYDDERLMGRCDADW